MKRQSFVSGAVISLVAALAVCEGCGGSNRGPTGPIPSGPTAPTAPSGPVGPPRPSGPTYTISGVITEYRGGPLGGATVVVFSCNHFWGIPCDTQTDQQGHYTVASPSAEPTALGVWKQGYQQAWKNNVSAQDSTANFVLHRSIAVSAFGGTLTETIWGDELMGGDDVLFGGLCVHTACKVMEFGNFIGPPRRAEVRLRWTDPRRQLALYKFNGDPDSILDSVQPADRYSGSSELIATVSVGGYFDAIAVAFEQAGGGPPGPADSQQFELTVQVR